MKFELEDKQLDKLKEWQSKIKELHGEYGIYDYIFTPYGIGEGVKVYSHLSQSTIDLTEVEKW